MTDFVLIGIYQVHAALIGNQWLVGRGYGQTVSGAPLPHMSCQIKAVILYNNTLFSTHVKVYMY